MTSTIDDLCSRFEAVWKSGAPPSLGAFLGDVAGPARAELLRELIEIDLNYRRRRGEEPGLEDYAARFGPLPPEWAAAPPADEWPDIERYKLLDRLGAGGMGVVVRGRDRVLEREVAVKLMRPTLAADPVARQRFLREAQALAAIDDEHVVPVLDIGEENGWLYFVMPLLRGETLAERLRRVGPLAPADAVRLGECLAWGLTALHARGVVHRDLKPTNIWIGGGGKDELRDGERVRLFDLGLARVGLAAGAGEAPKSLTASGLLVGTLAYMAPEQADDAARAEPLSDLFSLGCVLYEAATGRRAFDGARPMHLLRQLAAETPPPPASLRPELEDDFSDLIMELLAKEPSRRPPSAREVALQLRGLAPPVKAPPRRRRGGGRFRFRIVIEALLVGVLAGGTVVYFADLARAYPAARWSSDPDRAAAALARSFGDHVKVEVDIDENERLLGPAEPLPAAPFRICRLVLQNTTAFGDDDLKRLVAGKPLASLKALNLNGTGLMDDGLAHLARLPKLRHLRVGNLDRVTDRGMERIAELKDLTSLYLDEARLTDDGLKPLAALPQLQAISLTETRIGDKGMDHVAQFPALVEIDLRDTAITDAGLRKLVAVKTLRKVELRCPGVSTAAVQAFRAARPDVQVVAK